MTNIYTSSAPRFVSERLPPSHQQPVDWILAVRPHEPRWTCPMDVNRSSNVNGDSWNRSDSIISNPGSDTSASSSVSDRPSRDRQQEVARPKVNDMQAGSQETPCLSGFSIQVYIRARARPCLLVHFIFSSHVPGVTLLSIF